VLRTQNDKSFSCHEYRVVCAVSCRSVIAVRVSGGHLCEAEAPTEPAGETAVRRVAIRFLFLKDITDSFVFRTQNDKSFSCHEYRVVCAVSCRAVIASAVRRVAIRFLFLKGITDSFVLRTQNDKSFSCHEYRVVCAVSCRSVIASTVRCAAIRSLLKGRRILSCLPLLRCPKVVFAWSANNF